MKKLTSDEVLAKIKGLNSARKYRAMYSTLWDGLVTEPELMLIPMDDHLVHRGDGVFEAVRVTPNKIFLLEEHIQRLFRSADSIGLKIPRSLSEVVKLCEEACEGAGVGPRSKNKEEGMIRLFVGRGPGDFSVNPYATVGAQIYLVITDFKPMPKDHYAKGVSLLISKVATKPAPYSQIKSCNYLQNVMMKKESIDQGYDFALSLNDEGVVAEGPTENIMILNKKNELVAPRFDYTLRGTTLVRVMKLAEKLKFKSIRVDDISLEDLMDAQEVMMVGTTLGVLPVTKIEQKILSLQAGPMALQLNQMIMQDMGAV